MFIYDIYRLDYMSLRTKLSRFLVSVMDTLRYSTRFIFIKNGAHLNIENRLLQNLQTHTPEKDVGTNERKNKKGFSVVTDYPKEPHNMEDKE